MYTNQYCHSEQRLTFSLEGVSFHLNKNSCEFKRVYAINSSKNPALRHNRYFNIETAQWLYETMCVGFWMKMNCLCDTRNFSCRILKDIIPRFEGKCHNNVRYYFSHPVSPMLLLLLLLQQHTQWHISAHKIGHNLSTSGILIKTELSPQLYLAWQNIWVRLCQQIIKEPKTVPEWIKRLLVYAQCADYVLCKAPVVHNSWILKQLVSRVPFPFPAIANIHYSFLFCSIHLPNSKGDLCLKNWWGSGDASHIAVKILLLLCEDVFMAV